MGSPEGTETTLVIEAANHGAEPPSDSRNSTSSHHLSILRIAPPLLVNREFF